MHTRRLKRKTTSGGFDLHERKVLKWNFRKDPKYMGWIELVRDRTQFRGLVNAVIKSDVVLVEFNEERLFDRDSGPWSLFTYPHLCFSKA
jgi:hypothetical protein